MSVIQKSEKIKSHNSTTRIGITGGVVLAAGLALIPACGGSRPLMVLESGRYSAGQIEAETSKVRIGGEDHVRSVANISDGCCRFRWIHYQKIENGNIYVLNPSYGEASNPRSIGVVMRNAVLTNGMQGDFVVRVYGNMTRPASAASEWDPILESDGRIRPENALYQLETGSLRPVQDTRFKKNLGDVSRQKTEAFDTVREFGPTTSIVLVEEK